MSNNHLIIRDNNFDQYGAQPVSKMLNEVSQKHQRIIHGYALPQIALKNSEKAKNNPKIKNEVVLVNGCWDTSNKIPNIIAEMHNADDIKMLQHTCNDGRDFINPSPDSGFESDCTDGNLSWLLNYKILELPPVPDVVTTNDISYGATNPEIIVQNDINVLNTNARVSGVKTISPREIPTNNNKNNAQSYRYAGSKKPPFTYTELIEHALTEKGELTVSGIYQWISDRFPFYKQNDDRWKNSVRHNLSINPHFRKGSKAVHGAGHLWTIAQRDNKKSWQIKQRMQQFIQTTFKKEKCPEEEALDMELQAATASILGESFNDFQQNNENETKPSKIEVEFVNIIDAQNGLEDFLSPPVSKQQIVQECGLGNDFLITDLNPNTLGINLTDGNNGEVIHDGNFYDDITLEYYDMEKQ